MKRSSRRPYELAALVAVRERRQIGLYWTRRGRKSTTLGTICFDEMSREPGRMCIAASASLLLGKELVTMTLTSAEQAMAVLNEANAVRDVFDTGAEERGLQLQVANSSTNKLYGGLTPEDFADLYKSSNMELRLYFDNSAYSRLQVIAPNPATARSWRALVVRDECGFTEPNFELALRIATDAMVRDTPDLKIVYASNLPANDKHPWFKTTLPRELAKDEDEQFPPNVRGHFYIGQDGILIHRVALKDAYEAGHRLYDDAGNPMTLEQARKHPQISIGYDESYGLNHKSGGAAAIDYFALLTSQQRGIGNCSFVYVQDESDFRMAIDALRINLRGGPVGVGFDIATTVKQTSNPSSVTITERNGTERAQRLVVLWKEKKPAIVRERLRALFKAIKERPEGGAARRFCILATSERLFSEDTAEALRDLVPTQLIIESENVKPHPAGYKESSVNFKTFLGDIYSSAVNDNRYALPPGDYFNEDQRMTLKNAGRYECDPDPHTGAHGDTFSSGSAAEFALSGPGAPIEFDSAVPDEYATSRTGEVLAAEGRFAL